PCRQPGPQRTLFALERIEQIAAGLHAGFGADLEAAAEVVLHAERVPRLEQTDAIGDEQFWREIFADREHRLLGRLAGLCADADLVDADLAAEPAGEPFATGEAERSRRIADHLL